MKKYVYKFSGYFGAFVLVLFGCFGFTGEVKADVIVNDLTFGSGSISIPDYDNDAMVICVGNYDLDFVLNSVSSVELTDAYNVYNNNTFEYVLNPPKNDSSTFTGSPYSCVLISGLADTDPYTLDTSFTVGVDWSNSTTWDLPDLEPENNNSFILDFGYSTANNINFAVSYYDEILKNIDGYGWSALHRVNALDEIYQVSFDYCRTTWAYKEIIFNEPPSPDYILYYGEDPVIDYVGGFFDDLPVVYNICDSWSATSTYELYLVYPDAGEGVYYDSEAILFCSGVIRYNEYTKAEPFSDDEAYFEIKNTTLSEVVATSNTFDSSVENQEFGSGQYIYPIIDPFRINTGYGAGTSTLEFNYNVCDDESFLASTTIFYLNNDDVSLKLEFEPTLCVGKGEINMPYEQYLNYSFPASISYYNNDVEKFKSKAFSVVFHSDYNPYTGIETATSSGEIVDFGNRWLLKLVNVFPFNIPIAIAEAWGNSATETLTSDLSFLAVADDNGDVKASFPKEWVGTSTDLEIDIFGGDYLASGSLSASALFDNFRKFTKWLQYFAFAFGIIALGKTIISSLTENKSDDV